MMVSTKMNSTSQMGLGRRRLSVLSVLLGTALTAQEASALFVDLRARSPTTTPSNGRSFSHLHAQVIEEDPRIFSFPLDVPGLKKTEPVKEGASMPVLTVSLVKSIVGGGVLALPAGIAALGDAPEAVIPVACGMIAVMGAINAYYFSLMGRVCSWTSASTYTEAWERTVGDGSKTVAGIIAMKTALACLCYSIILADSFQSLAISAGFLDVSRTEALAAVTLTALLPLCLMKDLSSLAYSSLAGILGFCFTAASLVVRHTDGTYELGIPYTEAVAAPTGTYASDLPAALLPAFGDTGPSIQGIVLACTLATCFVAHYNAPRFHAELSDKSDFDTVSYGSYAIAAAIMAVTAVAGFETFGASTQAVIFNNYSHHDPLITGCRAITAMAIAATFPLPFVGLRDGVLDLLPETVDRQDDDVTTALSVALLAGITLTAAVVQDLGLVLAVGGGTISTTVSSVFPTLMFRAAARKNPDKATSIDETASLVLMGLCVAIGGTGVTIALHHALNGGVILH